MDINKLNLLKHRWNDYYFMICNDTFIITTFISFLFTILSSLVKVCTYNVFNQSDIKRELYFMYVK